MTLRELRERARLTQEQLAEASGLHQTTVSQLETGRLTNPNLSTLEGLSGAFGVSIETVVSALAETISEAA